jgi:hypothetical protein
MVGRIGLRPVCQLGIEMGLLLEVERLEVWRGFGLEQ